VQFEVFFVEKKGFIPDKTGSPLERGLCFMGVRLEIYFLLQIVHLEQLLYRILVYRI